MNGKASEHVAAYRNNGEANIELRMLPEYFENKRVKKEYAKYWEEYQVGAAEIAMVDTFAQNPGLEYDASYNGLRKTIANDRYNLIKEYKGSAMFEVINTYSYYGRLSDAEETWAWIIDETSGGIQHGRSYYNRDAILLGGRTREFMVRGSTWKAGELSGVFAIIEHSGGGDLDSGFRPTIVL